MAATLGCAAPLRSGNRTKARPPTAPSPARRRVRAGCRPSRTSGGSALLLRGPARRSSSSGSRSLPRRTCCSRAARAPAVPPGRPPAANGSARASAADQAAPAPRPRPPRATAAPTGGQPSPVNEPCARRSARRPGLPSERTPVQQELPPGAIGNRQRPRTPPGVRWRPRGVVGRGALLGAASSSSRWRSTVSMQWVHGHNADPESRGVQDSRCVFRATHGGYIWR